MERKWSRKQLTVQRKGGLPGERVGRAALVPVTPNGVLCHLPARGEGGAGSPQAHHRGPQKELLLPLLLSSLTDPSPPSLPSALNRKPVGQSLAPQWLFIEDSSAYSPTHLSIQHLLLALHCVPSTIVNGAHKQTDNIQFLPVSCAQSDTTLGCRDADVETGETGISFPALLRLAQGARKISLPFSHLRNCDNENCLTNSGGSRGKYM